VPATAACKPLDASRGTRTVPQSRHFLSILLTSVDYLEQRKKRPISPIDPRTRSVNRAESATGGEGRFRYLNYRYRAPALSGRVGNSRHDVLDSFRCCKPLKSAARLTPSTASRPPKKTDSREFPGCVLDEGATGKSPAPRGRPQRHQRGLQAVAQWLKTTSEREIAFRPARVLMQDFTGVPAVVDLAAMRDA